MSSFSDLPTELTTDILSAAIPQHPIPSCILAVNSRFNAIGQRIIYTSLRFKSESQLVRFALKRHLRSPHGQLAHRSHLRIHQYTCARQEANGASDAAASTTTFGETSATCQGGTSDSTVELLPYTPRSISVWVPGGQGYGAAFEEIKRVFELCAEVAGERVLELDSLEFCLHSRMTDSAPWEVSEALSLVNPRKFVWRGPEPPHYFSTSAIVPYATYHFFHSIRNWSNLQSLTLANVTFPPHGTYVPVSSSGPCLTYRPVDTDDGLFSLLNTLPNLRSVCVGQATLVPVRSIVRLALAGPQTEPSAYDKVDGARCREGGRNSGLREIRLRDACTESTLRKRIGRSDLEAVALEIACSDTPVGSLYYAPTGEVDSVAVVERIREIISCEG